MPVVPSCSILSQIKQAGLSVNDIYKNILGALLIGFIIGISEKTG